MTVRRCISVGGVCSVAALLAIAAGAVARSVSPRRHMSVPCDERKGSTTLRNGSVRVFSTGDGSVYACVRPNGATRTVFLNPPAPPTFLETLKLAGVFVESSVMSEPGIEGSSTVLSLLDVSIGAVHTIAAAGGAQEGPDISSFGAIVLNEHGTIVWDVDDTTCQSMLREPCRTTSTIYVRTWRGQRLMLASATINSATAPITSLSLIASGHRVSWRTNGTPHTALL